MKAKDSLSILSLCGALSLSLGFSIVTNARNVVTTQLRMAGKQDVSAASTTMAGKIPLATDPNLIRNLAVVGHSHSGKSALTEWMLFDEQVLTKRPTSGASSLDYDPMESSRHSSVFSHYARVPHAGHCLEMSDTPWGDFPCDALASLDGADAALVVVSAADGVQSGTLSAIQHCQSAGIRMMIALSKMDRPFIDAQAVVSDVQATLDGVVPLQVPISEGDEFGGVRSLLVVDENGQVSRNLEEDDNGDLGLAWTELEEAVSMTDDSLLMQYLEEGQLNPEQVVKGLRKGVVQGKLVPLVYTSAEQDLGVQELMDAIVAVGPSPLDMREEALRAACEQDALKCNLVPGIESGFSARVLHTNVDSFGSVSVLRVISNGRKDSSYDTIPSEVVVLRSGDMIKMPASATCFGLVGKEKLPLSDGSSVLPGDVIAVPRLSEAVRTNDILTVPSAVQEEKDEILIEASSNHLTPLSRQAEGVPLMASAAVSLTDAANDKKNKRGGGKSAGSGGEEKLLSSLRAMSREDLAMSIEQDPSGALLLNCMSSDHLNIIAARLEQRYGLVVDLSNPPVPYRETLAKEVKSIEGRHKKQSGGSGQFGVCVIDMEPMEEGSGIEFVSRIKGGVISKPFISSVEKGAMEQLKSGGLLGFPVTDVRITLVDGKMHSVDSKDIAFQSAGRLAVKAALEKGRTHLLQPMEKVVFTVTEQLQGDVSGIVARGDGYLLSTDIADDGVHIVVEAILATSSLPQVSDYLRAASGGEAQFTSTFSHYSPVPTDLVDSVLGESEEGSSNKLHP